ncbi:MAG: type II secretion system F family protein [Anaerolineales bacterium]|nr:MAG: secretion system protein [Chloroflexota bacterium]MBE7435180.1 type II secretion system F family protein [Anaerolineales bacterium]MCE7858458.1 secretion system protein [Chloroflexi bacterium CFX2]MCK6582024.1 type II secretion system F family protein [Anaerolineales bacterium]GJQ37028.1 MAG: secretion system protein [Anaerolineaceae bacterium]
MEWIIIVGGIVLIVLLIFGLIASLNSERSLVEERLSQYIEDEGQKNLDREAQKYVITNWVSKRVEKTPFGGRIARDLARADLKFKVAEYIVLIALSILFFGLVAWFIGNQHWFSALIGAVFGAIAPRMYVRSQQRKRLQKFSDQLPDMLNLMVNGLRAGYSTMQAMEAISKELPAPINDEFRRVVQELQIGIPMETALDNLLRRIPSDDLDFVVTAINVQREVGGNLSEILDNISFTIRERIRIKGEVRVLTAQVRTSGTVLSLIPFGLTLILWFLNPDYLLSITDRGMLCAGIIICVVLGLIFSGYFVMMRIADIEV